ncbi:MAG: hypothetical protein K0S33_2088 [Bacteroidetes bacterium]|jgi:hypothetical protein|nr:hypothetical protein [Bacteroidota bacterium]
MLKQPIQNLLLKPVLYLILPAAFSCVSDTYREQGAEQGKGSQQQLTKTDPMYKDLDLSLALQQSEWKGNEAFKTKAEIRSMQLIFDLTLSPVNTSLIPLSANKKDTFAETILTMEVLFDGKPIEFDIPNPEKSWLKRTSLQKLPGTAMSFTSGTWNLTGSKDLRLVLPLFIFSGLKANSEGTVSIRVWQDLFIGPQHKKETRVPIGAPVVSYYHDTLRTKLIDNTYSFSFTIPRVYRTAIICDSLILQNDSEWSTSGSDNTIFKSSYPDIYFSVKDLYENKQNSSETQKSTTWFSGDSISFFHYSPSEPFSITVYDYDVLSKDDVLGDWKGELSAFENNKRYPLKFGHIKTFYFRKKECGQMNK